MQESKPELMAQAVITGPSQVTHGHLSSAIEPIFLAANAFYSADIGIMNFGSPLDSVACCLMLVAGGPISQQIFPSNQLQLSQTRHVRILHPNCLTKHCILRRGPRAPAHTRSLAIALQRLF